MALGHHLMLGLIDRRVLALCPLERRLVARVVLAQGRRDGLLAFGLADTHVHLLSCCSREAAGQLARRIEISLCRRLSLEIGFSHAHIKPISDGRHLRNAFIYILEQNARHGLEWDPLHEATNLPDLLGLRLQGADTVINVRRQLPRIKREDLLACLDLTELGPADEPLGHVLWATLAAAGLPHLDQKSREADVARRALVKLVGYRLRASDLTVLLHRSTRMVYELRRRPAESHLLRAIRLQLGLIQQRVESLHQWARPFMGSDPP